MWQEEKSGLRKLRSLACGDLPWNESRLGGPAGTRNHGFSLLKPAELNYAKPSSESGWPFICNDSQILQ